MFKSDYKKLEEKYSEVNQQVTTLTNTISLLNKELDEYKDMVEDLNSSNELAKVSAQAEILELKQQIRNTQNSVNAKVNSVLASVGVKSFALETISIQPTMTPQSALSKFTSLVGSDKAEFFKNNKDLITQGLLLPK